MPAPQTVLNLVENFEYNRAAEDTYLTIPEEACDYYKAW
jgi:hypothetical protein